MNELHDNNIDTKKYSDIQNFKETFSREEMENIFENMDKDLEELGLFPHDIIQGARVVNIDSDNYFGALEGRPYIVYDMKKDNEHYIFKCRTKSDPENSTKNEILFTTKIAPWLTERMPDKLKDKILFPKIIKYQLDTPFPYFIENLFDGKMAGQIHNADPEILNQEDVESLAEFVKFFQDNVNPEAIKSIVPDIRLSPLSIQEKYKIVNEPRKNILKNILNPKQYDEYINILHSCDEVFINAPWVPVLYDIQPANIIKKDKNLQLFDFEKLDQFNNPAFDYVFLFADLWTNPELQKQYFHKVMEINKNIPNFKEYFRLDFIYNRGGGEVCHWSNILNTSNSTEEKQQAEMSIKSLSDLLRDAIDKKGIWSD